MEITQKEFDDLKAELTEARERLKAAERLARAVEVYVAAVGFESGGCEEALAAFQGSQP